MTRDEAGKSGPIRVVLETGVLVLVAVVLAVVVKTFFVQAFYIPSGSMEPGLRGGPGSPVNDRILVEKPSYWGSAGPSRGDIVVFKDPGGWLPAEEDAGPTGGASSFLAKIGLYPSGGHLVKRVIGLPGDTVVCCDDQGRISVNGHALDEDSYIAPQTQCNGPMAGCGGWTATVPKGRIFVMGDNRGESADSSWHLCKSNAPADCDPSGAFVPLSDVVGKVFAVVWPASDAKWIHRPADFKAIPSP
ncbi:MAG: signal peptidase I [Nocardioidaceae bacterium]